MRAVLERRPPLPFLRAGLTAQDIYYSQVSGIEDVLPSLLAHQTDHLGDIDSPVERLGIVINVGTTIEVRMCVLLHSLPPLFIFTASSLSFTSFSSLFSLSLLSLSLSRICFMRQSSIGSPMPPCTLVVELTMEWMSWNICPGLVRMYHSSDIKCFCVFSL